VVDADNVGVCHHRLAWQPQEGTVLCSVSNAMQIFSKARRNALWHSLKLELQIPTREAQAKAKMLQQQHAATKTKTTTNEWTWSSFD